MLLLKQHVRILKFIFLSGILFLSASVCAQTDTSGIVHRFILIGDAGRLLNGKSIVSDAVANHVNRSDSTTTILFLGDNIYEKGLPDKEDNNYAEYVEVLSKQLLPFESYAAKVYMIPGNHDWQKSGPEGWERIKREAAWIDSLHQDNIFFLPKEGCPGPEEIHINDSLVFVILDTQWWLHPFEKPGIDNGCNCKTEDDVINALKDIAYRNRNKRIVFTSHQPMRSYGIHGGYYTWKQHIFPFTEMSKNAYIPLPVLGSLYPLVRGTFGNIQDLKHPEYRNMVKRIEDAMSIAPDVIYAGGHDHSLQHIQEGKQNYIVSGSGINRERVKKGKNAAYVTDQRGFVEVVYRTDGSEQIIMYAVDEQSNYKIVYDTILPIVQLPKTASLENIACIQQDSITVAIAPEYNEVNNAHRFWFGDNYRTSWATPVTLKVFYIQKEGLEILQQGGGQQTKSLRLVDSTGKEWVLRTVQKDPAKALPDNLRGTVAKTIVQDQISAAQPYAPLTVPILAEELNVPHANPQIVFVPNDPALGIYRTEFANTVCVFEEREPASDDGAKTYNTAKVLEKLQEDNDNLIDEKAVLTARMLDLLIGDWDRHEDQWRWEKRVDGKKNIYSPIPRDRDQTYFINSGLLPYIAARKWIMPKIQGFDAKIRDVNGFMFNAKYFDRFFLNELSEAEWIVVLKHVQQTLTDSILAAAVNQLPDTVYAQYGEQIRANLIARRNALLKEGLKYYAFLAHTVEIPGSDKDDYFEVNYQNHGDIVLKVYKIKKDGSKGNIFYERTFNKKVTKEIRLYGRDGDDVFDVTGKGRSSIKVRMIGGAEKDSFNISKSIHSRTNIVVYDRSDKNNAFPKWSKAVVHKSTDPSINEYNGRTFKYNQLLPQASGGYNVDDGIWLGAGLQYTKYGFRKEPYAQRHRLLLGHALATKATNVKYYGHFVNVIGKNDLKINFDARAPDNVSNFFGVGNETQYIKMGEQPITYYRTRYNLITAQIKLEHTFARTFKVYGGLIGQYYATDSMENVGRYINVYDAANPDENVFTKKIFAGLIGGFQLDTRNSEFMPIRGVYWNTFLTGMQQLDEHNQRFGRFETDMTVYTSFHKDPRFVLINHFGGGINVGDPYYFQMCYLGGSTNLRGYRNYRFAGNSKFFYNIEMRLKLFDFTSYLFPGSIGLIAFNDLGRVWAHGEESGQWHDGYGGGFYIAPAKMLVVNLTLGCSKEGVLPYISLGVKL
ncbi:BamA/TamA family outer membrane protein [Cytophaga aurantiaca]|uniref:BamA/TamA family outer membrane protein n=1 Tax=Cytophaga aurantiaca TaxID=29530 RepID=UPI000378FCAB|nr:BamA/TamA family outer membrane protein [Cytophaga aurantiaca]